MPAGTRSGWPTGIGCAFLRDGGREVCALARRWPLAICAEAPIVAPLRIAIVMCWQGSVLALGYVGERQHAEHGLGARTHWRSLSLPKCHIARMQSACPSEDRWLVEAGLRCSALKKCGAVTIEPGGCIVSSIFCARR